MNAFRQDGKRSARCRVLEEMRGVLVKRLAHTYRVLHRFLQPLQEVGVVVLRAVGALPAEKVFL